MKIEAHIIVWNREESIQWTVNHYKSFCSKVTVYDNFSTDNTRDIALLHGADVKLFGQAGILNDQAYLDVKNNCWKGSDADWVIVVDDDEILWHPNLVEELQFAHDAIATIVQPQGFGIFSKEMPVSEWTELMSGVPDSNYSKMCCFNPRDIKEIGYVFGCHAAKPQGRVRLVNKLYLLHYKAVGGAERLVKRNQECEPRRKLSAINMRWNLGFQYGEPPEVTRKWFETNLENSKILSVPGIGGQ